MEHKGTTGGHGRSDMIGAVGQLVSSVSAGMKSKPSNMGAIAIEDVLAQLETTDENFHSYDLVRNLRGRVEGAVGRLVDNKLESSVLVGDGHNAVADITDSVLTSTEYTQMYQGFVSDLRAAVDEMLADESLLTQLPSEQESDHTPSTCSSATQYFNLDDSACTSELLSVHQTGIMFMSHDQLQSIADTLNSSHNAQVRIDGMRHLLQFPSGDLVGCENWATVNAAIRRNLMDENKQLANLCLEFYNRMYAAHLSVTTKCVYLDLAEELIHLFQTSPLTGSSLNLSDGTCTKLLEMFRLLNHVQQSLPSFWLRYNEKVVQSVIRVTFDLLSLSYTHRSTVGPLHYLGLLDPRGAWFRKWMHGQYSRSMVLETISENTIMLQGVVSCVLSTKASSLSHKQGSARQRVTTEADYVYNKRALDHLHFVHSLSVLERLLLYERGRELFPVTLAGSEARRVSVTDVLCHLIDLLYSLSTSVRGTDLTDQTLCPKHVISHLFEEIASGNALCRQTLCDMELIMQMIKPLQSTTTSNQATKNEVLVLMGEILSLLASTENGRQFILYGGNSNTHSPSPEAPVHIIAKFVVDTLSTFSQNLSALTVSPKVAVTWLFVCRHLYNTSYGLLVLESYQLHKHIAAAWKKVKSAPEGSLGVDMDISALKEALIDNLLNFAGTPKGLLLLYQSGLMSTCTAYMHQRYSLKLQVSKHEKFGYGCMVTQLASTAAGIAELNKCGFISMLVSELWGLMDEGEDDYRLTAPRDHPLDPTDRTAHKAVINLLNVLSSYPALVEVLQKGSHKGSPPTTVFDLLDTLVLTDSEVNQKRVLNYNEAHLFGLRILSTLVTCLDSLLYLEWRYKLTEVLFSLQRDNKMEDSSDIDSDFIVVDECSVERNHILVSCYLIGGPNERVLPPHYLVKAEEEYTWPLFSSYPPPAVYQRVTTTKPSQTETPSALLKHLTTGQTSSLDSDGWLHQTRLLFESELTEKRTLSYEVVSALLPAVVGVLSSQSSYAVFSSHNDSLTDSTETTLTQVDELGIEMVVRYGQLSGALPPNIKSTTVKRDIGTVLKRVKGLLQSQQHRETKGGGPPSALSSSFDWFTSTAFLVMNGSTQTTIELLERLSTLVQSAYLWPVRIHCSVHLPADITFSDVSPTTYLTAHFVDFILQSEVPLVSSAIRMSGYAVSQICEHWLRQCFWNFLDWSEITLYLALCVLYGVDYQVYYCVSILKHLECAILQHTQEQGLMVFLKENSLTGYHCADWIGFMTDLQRRFRDIVLPAMLKMT